MAQFTAPARPGGKLAARYQIRGEVVKVYRDGELHRAYFRGGILLINGGPALTRDDYRRLVRMRMARDVIQASVPDGGEAWQMANLSYNLFVRQLLGD